MRVADEAALGRFPRSLPDILTPGLDLVFVGKLAHERFRGRWALTRPSPRPSGTPLPRAGEGLGVRVAPCS